MSDVLEELTVMLTIILQLQNSDRNC